MSGGSDAWGGGGSDPYRNFKAVQAMIIVLRWRIIGKLHKMIKSPDVMIMARTASKFQMSL